MSGVKRSNDGVRLLSCPFCGVEAIYEIKREDGLGTVIPQLFCNACKMIFEIENNSPYLDDERTFEYLREKLYKQWNTRKPMEWIVEMLKEQSTRPCLVRAERNGYARAIEIVKEGCNKNGRTQDVHEKNY